MANGTLLLKSWAPYKGALLIEMKRKIRIQIALRPLLLLSEPLKRNKDAAFGY